MQQNWLYLHEGQTHGPFPVAEMKERAAQGMISPTDKIWGEGSDPKTAILAKFALPFPRKPVETAPPVPAVVEPAPPTASLDTPTEVTMDSPVMEAQPVMPPVPEEEPAKTFSPGLARAILAVREPNLSVAELYRRAHFALSQWTDQDENAELILAGDTEAMLMQPEVLEILRAFQGVPFEILERLMESLDFLVENRSKYYRALAQRQK